MRRVLAAVLAVLAGSAQAQTELQDIGCAGESGLRSIEDTTSTEVIFFNQSPTTIRTYWLDHQGNRQFKSEIRPGDSFVQQTYVTHPWVVTSAAKACMAIFQPEASSAIVVVR
jgi:hypothetical protein